MLLIYVRSAWRQLRAHTRFSFLNIAGLSVGMSVAMLIGLWVWYQLSFDHWHAHYDRIAEVREFETYAGKKKMQNVIPAPLEKALQAGYGSHFKHIVLATEVWKHVVKAGGWAAAAAPTGGGTTAGAPGGGAGAAGATGAGAGMRAAAGAGIGTTGAAGAGAQAGVTETEKMAMATEKVMGFNGAFMDADGPELFSLHMLSGSRLALNDPSSVLVSASTAKALFGGEEAIGRTMLIDNQGVLKVAGVYEDLPENTTLRELRFVASMGYYLKQEEWAKSQMNSWTDESFLLYVQIADGESMEKVSGMIRDVKRQLGGPAQERMHTTLFLHPMSKWRLYGEFTDGVNTGGVIRYCVMYSIIGGLVLLLACINFMNLSTARSEKRAREVGVRKAIGSSRRQLIVQFYTESLVMAVLSFVLSLLLTWLSLPAYSVITEKTLTLPIGEPMFWILSLGFTLFTALVAGSYPALYLSAFRPIKVLKGGFRVGRLSALPREILVVVQFVVSVVMIIGTLVVYQQIQYVKDRPVGYTREGLVNLEPPTNDLEIHFDEFRRDVLETGLFTEVAQSSSPTTAVYNNRDDLEWAGKDPGVNYSFANVRVSTEFGKTVGWQFVAGRDFDRTMATDSSAVILNEAAVHQMGLEHPVGEIVRFRGKNNRVIGVIRDMVMNSPYEPVKQTVFYITPEGFGFLNARVRPGAGVHAAVAALETISKKYSPSMPFVYAFADDAYATKFAVEERIGRQAICYTVLAIFISCLGLFGITAFVAERRVKEIGVRKVLGASVASLWRLLSGSFVRLVLLALVIAVPAAFVLMNGWLGLYYYHTGISWWVVGGAAVGVVVITLVTVSWEVLRAARANPTDCLRNE